MESNYDENGEYFYPEGYDAGSYADDYQQQQGYGGYDDVYTQQEAQETEVDPGYDGYYEYHDEYEAVDGVEESGGVEGDYGYYADGAQSAETYAETPEAWSYSPETEGDHSAYFDQVAAEQTAGYYYDEEGNLIDGDGGAESPMSVFNQEAYWQTGPQDYALSYDTDATTIADYVESSPGDTNTEGLTDTSIEAATGEIEGVKIPKKAKKQDQADRAASPSRRRKTRKERIEKRQELLEKEEEEKLKAQESAESTETPKTSAGETKTTAKPKKILSRKLTFVDREKAKFQLKLRIARAIKKKRMPVQIRILTSTRKYLSPLEKYFGSTSVESVLSDIFWASIKGDLGRVRHLVEVEGESATDGNLDPWGAAKGGSVAVVNYLLSKGASPRALDENGSLPLHLSCWAGHADASIVLLRSSDVKDLYVQDYDAAMCPLDWANVRGHTPLLRAIEKYQDSLWLPKFVDDLIRGIVRYKIKIFKDPPKKPGKAATQTSNNAAAPEQSTTPESGKDADKGSEKSPDAGEQPPSAKKSLLKRITTEKLNRKTALEDKAPSSKSLP